VEELLGKVVVIDVESPFVYVGKLFEIREKSLVLKQADAHDLRDSTTTREIYVRDARVVAEAASHWMAGGPAARR